MAGSVIDRPETSFDGESHSYGLEGWDDNDVYGVSTIAKVGEVEETWGVASAWGFRIGYEGAFDLAQEHGALRPFDVEFKTKEGSDSVCVETRDSLREAMRGRGLTPWSKRDKAAARGTWVHDMLEAWAQNRELPNLVDAEAEVRGHATSLLRWYIHCRPEFVAVEVQVASREHGFAGRYDIRALIDARRILPCVDPIREDPQAVRIRQLASEGKQALGLLDLKTSKGIYATSHFPQLEGYEGGSVEMGFPETDFRAVINTNEDGSFDPAFRKRNHKNEWVLGDFAVSWATYEDFLAYLGAMRSIRRIKAGDPEERRRAFREEAILAALPARSRELADSLPALAGYDGRGVGYILGSMRKRGLVTKLERGIWDRAS